MGVYAKRVARWPRAEQGERVPENDPLMASMNNSSPMQDPPVTIGATTNSTLLPLSTNAPAGDHKGDRGGGVQSAKPTSYTKVSVGKSSQCLNIPMYNVCSNDDGGAATSRDQQCFHQLA